MEILIIIFIIIAVISKFSKKEAKKNTKQTSLNGKPIQTASVQTSSNRRTSTGEEAWQKAARENIEKAARRATSQIQQRRTDNRNTSILERAQGNAAEKKGDVTLNEMEAEHKHSERVSAAVHHHPEEVMPESMLGSVEDLMVKGYEGNLCFERDFIGEAMDMINQFTVPSDIPEYSSKEAS